MSDHALDTEVLIVGAGPAGLMLAYELALAGVRATVLERALEPLWCRGYNLNARSLDLLERRGLAEGFIAEGHQVPNVPATGIVQPLSLAGTWTDHPFSLGIAQTRVEEVLAERAIALGANVLRGREVRGIEQDAESVTATVLSGGDLTHLTARYLVGCDGGRSVVRKSAGIAFPGTDATFFVLLGDVECDLPYGLSAGSNGRDVFVIPRPGYVRVIVRETDPPADKDTPVTLELLQSQVSEALGRQTELRAPRWLTRFGDAARLAARFRAGRVLLAGDSAHIFPPAGAIGVNVAIDDAFNLGWKLAATVRGTAPEGLLDTYHDERHATGQALLANQSAQVLLNDRESPLADLVQRVAAHPAGNRALTEILTGLATCYLPGEHPWLGRLAPNLPLTTTDSETTLASLLHPGRPVLLDLTPERAFSTWSDSVTVISADCPAHPDIRALLLRPDGHTAWLSTTPTHDTGLPDALHRWVTPAPALTGSPAGIR
ncbi:FAD-dependent monooxygenase [Nocardia sp. NBC_01499]|uniref:FAD-dependent monooxygenase n=1 Tax=Nocardia sp. NBC_01499 TaxID=2903597 RepID=UPI003870BC67